MTARTTIARAGPSARQQTPGLVARLARANTRAMAELMTGAKEEMRDDVIAAGLGFRLAKTIRGVAYPVQGESLSPAAIVYATPGKRGARSAAAVLGQYERGGAITPVLGGGLAIPTDQVPRRRGGMPMSPREVEAHYDRKLFARRLRSGNTGLFLNLVSARSDRGQRSPTKGRVAQGRVAAPVLMFTLVKQVPGRKRLDFAGIVRRWGGRFGELAAANLKFESE